MWKSVAVCSLLVLCAAVCAEPNASCSGTFSSTTGTLLSPNYPFTVKAPQQCNWTFNVVTNQTYLYLLIEELDLSVGDSLTVFDGSVQSIYNESTKDLRDVVFVMDPVKSFVALKYLAASKPDAPQRFMASYTVEKGDNRFLTINDRGVIQSPIFSVLKPAAPLEYEWIITQKPGSNVHLSFKHFNITNGTLIVDKGNGETVNITGHILPNDIICLDNVKLSLTLPPSATNESCSFELTFSQYEFNCSRTMMVNETTSINFASMHTSDKVKCLVMVESPLNTVLTASLSVEPNAQTIPHAILIINDGGSRFSPNLLVYPTTSRTHAPNVLSTENRLWIEYMWNALERNPEVNVTLNVHNSGRSLSGSGTFNVSESNTTLVSNSSAFLLTVDANQQVVLTLHDTNLTTDSEILLYDGASQARLLGTFTLNMPRYEVPSTDSQMLVVAKNFRGNETFSASFVAAPKDCNSLTNGNFGSYHLNAIGANTNCFWNIVPSTSNISGVIAFTINQVNLKPGMTLTLSHRHQNMTEVIYNTTTNHTTAMTIQVASEWGLSLQVTNTANTTVTDLIVDATFVQQEDCSHLVGVTNDTVITSPNYPNPIQTSALCSWNVSSSSASDVLRFQLDDVHLPASQSLIFYQLSGQNRTLAANLSEQTNGDIILPGPVLLVWSSQLSSNVTLDKGFKITVSPIDIGGVYNGTVKEFETPGYPKKVVNTTTSVWSIRIPPTAGKVKVVSLTMAAGETSSAGKLQFYEGGSLQSEKTKMESVNKTNYLSTTDELTIEYTYVQDKNGGSAYKFSYVEYDCPILCDNKKCLHDAWRCNGINECGDNTDELNCTAQPIINTTTTGVPVATLVAMIFVMFILGVAFTLAAPYVYKRIRTQGNYQEFRNTAEA